MSGKVDIETGVGEEESTSAPQSPSTGWDFNPVDIGIIVDVDHPINGLGLYPIPSPPTATTTDTDSPIRGVKRQVSFQCLFVVTCCLLLFHKLGIIAPHLDLSKTEIDIFTIIHFLYNTFDLIDRVRFFLFAGKFQEIQPSIRFICSRMAATINSDVIVEMKPIFGYILMGAATLIGIWEINWDTPSLDLPPGKLLLELAGVFTQFIGTIFQIMYAALVVLIAKRNSAIMSVVVAKIQEKQSVDSGIISGQAFPNHLEMLKRIVTTVSAWVTVYYWLLWGFDLLLGSFGGDEGVPFDLMFVRVVLGFLSVGLAYCIL